MYLLVPAVTGNDANALGQMVIRPASGTVYANTLEMGVEHIGVPGGIPISDPATVVVSESQINTV